MPAAVADVRAGASERPAAAPAPDAHVPPGLRLRTREAGDESSLFLVFDQPLCRQGLITPPFANPDELARRLPVNRPHILEFVVVDSDRVIGFACVCQEPEARSHVGEISVFVHDAFHRRGVGACLLKTAIAAAERLQRIDRLELRVRTTNPAAIALYRRFGFVVEGRHVAFARLEGADIDVLSMARRSALSVPPT